MDSGYFDLILLLIIFIGLQLWWIIPIIKKNKDINKENLDLVNKIKSLERIFKNWSLQNV